MPVPALIVSGFLGSGKTTLVGHLLDEARRKGWKLAIISNEFGDTGIDRALLDAGEEGFVELDGGCVCCRLSDALVETVERVLDRADPDLLVLETSGVALPGEILVQFWRPPLDERLTEETVVVVVDAERLADGQAFDETTLAQIESADVFLLNKCDRADADAQATIERRLLDIAPDKRVIRTTQAKVSFDDLLDTRSARERAARRDPSAPMHPHSHEQFDTEELSFPEHLSEDEIIERVRSLDALRAKGFVRTPNGVRVIQAVGASVALDEPRVPVDPALVGRIVAIRRVAHSE